MDNKLKIVFFIGSLFSGGKERRMLELLSFLKKNSTFETFVVTTKPSVHYNIFTELGVYHQYIGRSRFFKVFSILNDLFHFFKDQKPEIVHTWGRMQTLYILPFKLMFKFHLINGQITNAPSGFSIGDKIIDRMNFGLSNIIVSNSQAGVISYKPPKDKTVVIPNGMRMERFEGLPEKDATRRKFGINSPFMIIMVATHSSKKNYSLFFQVAKTVNQRRSDVTFLSAGWFDASSLYYKENLKIIDNDDRIVLVGEIQDVESLVNVADVGILFSTASFGEGLSNSILEYMALSKPTIATPFGGSKELVFNGKTGYLVDPGDLGKIADTICELLNDLNRMKEMGRAAREIVDKNYTIEKMGERYLDLYSKTHKKTE